MADQRKQCPYCGEEIAASAKKCRFCGEWLESEPGVDSGRMSASSPAASVSQAAAISLPNAAVASKPRVKAKSSIKEYNPYVNSDDATYEYGEWHDEQGSLVGWNDDNAQSLFKAYGIFPFFKQSYVLNFTSPMPRRSFWWTYLYSALWLTLGIVIMSVLEVLGVLDGWTDTTSGTKSLVILGVVYLIFCVGVLAATSRRLADLGKSPAWLLIMLIPIVGPIWLFVLMCMPGESTEEYNPGRFKSVDGVVFGLWLLILIGASIFVVNAAEEYPETMPDEVESEYISEPYYAGEEEVMVDIDDNDYSSEAEYGSEY